MNYQTEKLNKTYKLVFIGLILLAIALRLYIFQTSLNKLPLSTDETLSTLQGKQILQGARPLFVMANPYQFPIESYIMAPLTKVFPQNRFGARILIVLSNFISLFLIIFSYFKTASLKEIWPGLLLILFPSSYLLVLQFAHNVPCHGFSIFLWSLCFFFMIRAKTTLSKNNYFLFIAATLYGFSFSVHMLSLSLIFMFSLFSCFADTFKKTLKNTFIFLPGLCLGLLPYLYGQFKFPEANQGVTNLRPIVNAFKILWSIALKYTVPGTMGITPPLYPDIKLRFEYLPYIDTIFTYLFVTILIIATIISFIQFCLRLKETRWPNFKLNDVFVGAIWISLILFILNKRSTSASFRYLLPLPFCFPFIVTYIYNNSKRFFKILVGTLTILISLYMTIISLQLMHRWKQTDFTTIPKFSNIMKVIAKLKEKNIAYCYASYHDVYRINYLSNNTIICSQPLNERFIGWHIPYKKEVKQQQDIAYVLTNTGHTLKPTNFEHHLKMMNISYQKEAIENFFIYTDFQDNFSKNESLINEKLINFSSSHNNKEANKLRQNSTLKHIWNSKTNQQKGMWVDLKLPEPMHINRISIHFGNQHKNNIPHLNIYTKTKEGWDKIIENQNLNFDKFEFINNHPSYFLKRHGIVTYRFTPQLTDTLKIEINTPIENQPWLIEKIDLYQKNQE